MEKTFSKLLGNRVYLEMPKKEESKIVLDENTKEALKAELARKMNKLKVVAIGEGVQDKNIYTGAFVLVDPEALARKALVVPISDKENVMLVSYFDIIHVW